ncbi:MAG TPA: DUF1906 domain-containing protein [Dehalococcoidia bacterium]|nr:DUF1906 domain-containing protein [Dehalococcoidia bacterium]
MGKREGKQMRRAAVLVFACSLLLVTAFVAGSLNSADATPVGGSGQVRYGVSQQKGFDTCSAPTTSQMQTWWTYSPYWDTIIYLGGSNRGCSQPNLTSSWVTTVHNQGWSFYLTWVGPQAPCNTQYGSRISYDTFTAYTQGKTEADRADAAAFNIGFTGYNVYYYDMENYNETDPACRDAVNSFINGWVYENHQIWGNKAGVYGNGCDAVKWTTIFNVPDDVWIADWNGDPDVWGLYCLPDGYWIYNQRLHQYWGNAWETYNGVTLLIDRDCANGLVTPHGHGWNDTTCTVE